MSTPSPAVRSGAEPTDFDVLVAALEDWQRATLPPEKRDLLVRAVAQLREARKDSARLDHFAKMLEDTCGSKMHSMIEVTFEVVPPDGGSVGVGFGPVDINLGSSAAEALRNAIDARLSPQPEARET